MDQGAFQQVDTRGGAFHVDEYFPGTVEDGAGETQFMRGHINEGAVAYALDPAGYDYFSGDGVHIDF